MATRFPFHFIVGHNAETAVELGLMVAATDQDWTWLYTSRSRPVALREAEWPEGFAESVDRRNAGRDGASKGRTLVVWEGPSGEPNKLRPVAALSWHAHRGNWPLAVLDCAYQDNL